VLRDVEVMLDGVAGRDLRAKRRGRKPGALMDWLGQEHTTTKNLGIFEHVDCIFMSVFSDVKNHW
jgi:hypothetical protein